MSRDFFAGFFMILGVLLLVGTVCMEASRYDWWINNQHHDLALPLFLALGIASMFYAYSRMDSLEYRNRFDRIDKQLQELDKDIKSIKENLDKK